MSHEFDAVLQRLEGKIKWIVLYVPFSVNDTYGTSGRLPVKATIDGHCFNGTLLPSKKGHYMVCNQQIRETCRKGIGDTVHVVIEPDSEPRLVQIPVYLLERLSEQPDILAAFQAQPEYIKREQLNHIEQAKGEEARERRIRKLLDNMQKRSFQ
jgi:hypothetical protein